MAAVVEQIIKWYADGRSHKKIALELNRKKFPAPRSKHGWAWTAAYGNPALKTEILNNPHQSGRLNKFRWEKDPEAGKHVPSVRPREEWINSIAVFITYHATTRYGSPAAPAETEQVHDTELRESVTGDDHRIAGC